LTLATEAVPTLRGKFLAYTDFANRGQLGPSGVVPRVLVTMPSEYRQQVMSRVVGGLPSPADQLVFVILHEAAVDTVTTALHAPG